MTYTRMHKFDPTRQSGYTLFSLLISTILGAAMMTGGWMLYRDMKVQWKVAHADRMMDQYAHSAMRDLTNTLSWGWAGVEIQGGSRALRWKLQMKDLWEENGPFRQWGLDRTRDLDGFITLTYGSAQGILYSGVQPFWASGERAVPWYQWVGRSPKRGEIRDFDQRDRMTVESMVMDWNLFEAFPLRDPIEAFRRQGVVDIQIVMHYQYSGGGIFGVQGMFGNRYVRERVYRTQVALRNWDVEVNSWKQSELERRG